MNSDQSGNLKKPPKLCRNCRKKIEEGKEYHHNKNVLCEDCCVDVCTPHVRKTHWQYLGSIKAGYLVLRKDAQSREAIICPFKDGKIILMLIEEDHHG